MKKRVATLYLPIWALEEWRMGLVCIEWDKGCGRGGAFAGLADWAEGRRPRKGDLSSVSSPKNDELNMLVW